LGRVGPKKGKRGAAGGREWSSAQKWRMWREKRGGTDSLVLTKKKRRKKFGQQSRARSCKKWMTVGGGPKAP